VFFAADAARGLPVAGGFVFAVGALGAGAGGVGGGLGAGSRFAACAASAKTLGDGGATALLLLRSAGALLAGLLCEGAEVIFFFYFFIFGDFLLHGGALPDFFAGVAVGRVEGFGEAAEFVGDGGV